MLQINSKCVCLTEHIKLICCGLEINFNTEHIKLICCCGLEIDFNTEHIKLICCGLENNFDLIC